MLLRPRVQFLSAATAVVLLSLAVQVALAQPTGSPTQIAGGGNITAVSDKSVTITRGSTPTTVTIDAATVVKIDGVVKTAADLKVGLYAMAFGASGKASEIRAYTPKASPSPSPSGAQIAGGGNITAVTATSVTITRSGTATTVTIDANTVVKIDDVVKTAADLKVGLYAMAFGASGKASEIRAYTPKPSPSPSPSQIAGGGNITAVSDKSVTITRGGTPTTVTIDANTVVKIDDVVKAAADLKVGLYAMAFGASGKASEIRAYTPKPK